MMSLLKLAARNALRNGRRTLLTAATVTIGTAFSVVTLSFISGLFNGMIEDWTDAFGPIRVVTTAFAEEELLQPIYENIPEAAPVLASIGSLPGISRAYPVIRSGVLVTLGEELGEDPALMVGSSPEYYAEILLPGSTLSKGAWLDPDAKGEQVVLGARVARDLGAKVGDEILMMGSTQYGSMSPISADVVGIISGSTTIDAQAFVTLDTARWMADIPDGAVELLVFPDDDSESGVAAAASELRASLGPDYAVTPWYDRDLWAQSKPILDAVQAIISLAVVFVMALAIFNTMTMSVLERTGEIGVMRAMGQSRMGAVTSFLTEAVLIGMAGALAGTALGAIPAWYLQHRGMSFSQEVLDEMDGSFAMSATLHGDLSVDILLTAVGIGVLTAALGALFPAIRATRIAPFEAMRAQR